MHWDLRSGQKIYSLEGHTGSVDSVVFSQSGSMIASGSMDNSVILWDAATGQLNKIIPENNKFCTAFFISSVAFSPDGEILAFARPPCN